MERQRTTATNRSNPRTHAVAPATSRRCSPVASRCWPATVRSTVALLSLPRWQPPTFMRREGYDSMPTLRCVAALDASGVQTPTAAKLRGEASYLLGISLMRARRGRSGSGHGSRAAGWHRHSAAFGVPPGRHDTWRRGMLLALGQMQRLSGRLVEAQATLNECLQLGIATSVKPGLHLPRWRSLQLSTVRRMWTCGSSTKRYWLMQRKRKSGNQSSPALPTYAQRHHGASFKPVNQGVFNLSLRLPYLRALFSSVSWCAISAPLVLA